MDIKRKLLLLVMLVGAHCNADSSQKKVCVIGAGPAGLSSLKQLSTWPNEFEPIAFERNSQIGGQWAYTENTDVDEHGLPVHSAVYKYLRTNLPKPLQAFPDYPELYGEERSFVKHQTLLEYLKNYTQHFDLHKYIKLNTLVEKVTPVRRNEWLIKTRNLDSNQQEETICNAVMICSGSFHKPNIPSIPGIQTFPGRILHSHSYRRPEDFVNQTVVILGSGSSGSDIGFEISSYATTVYFSHRRVKVPYELPRNMIEVPGVVAADSNQFILSNGSRITADSIVFCTGYLYDYSFLDASVGIKIEKGKYVHPLYKHSVHIERPTMGFITLLRTTISFPITYIQAYYFTSVLRGHVKLPSREEMLKDSELPAGKPPSKAHELFTNGLGYYDELAKISGAEPLPPFFKPTYYLKSNQTTYNMLHFREYNYVTNKNGKVHLVPIEE